MKIYIDSEFKCHTTPEDGLVAVETDFFQGKCVAFIEGYRFISSGSSWTRPDGQIFTGEMAVPFEDARILAAYQRQYESSQAALSVLQEKAAAYDILTGGAE